MSKDMEIGFDVMLNDAERSNLFKQWMVWSARQTDLYQNPSLFEASIAEEIEKKFHEQGYNKPGLCARIERRDNKLAGVRAIAQF